MTVDAFAFLTLPNSMDSSFRRRLLKTPKAIEFFARTWPGCRPIIEALKSVCQDPCPCG